jgi:hypothetical protein
MHLLPRSYDERVKTDLHTFGFKTAGNSLNYFPDPSEKLQTKVGRERLKRGLETFNAHVTKQKNDYDYFMANKRSIFASQHAPRWAPSSNKGYEFENFKSDPNNLYKKSLQPLDREPIQKEAFKRSTIQGVQFKNETASII